MDTTTSLSAQRSRGLAASLADYWQLIRPRIVALVLFTMTVAALVAGPRIPSWWTLFNALLGSGLVICGAIALNQRLESRSDARMPRTATRPVAAGRMSDRRAMLFGLTSTGLGIVYLALLVNWSIVALAAVSWVVYVWVYTPLKMFTIWQTPIGAFAGAMPALLGAAAADAPLSPIGLTLFGIVYFWQFPHAMAIAWLYRNQFAAADLKVATVVDPSGRSAATLSLVGGSILVPLSLIPWFLGSVGPVYAVAACLLGVGYLIPAIRFRRQRNDPVARGLLYGSLLYLPAVFAVLLVSLLLG